MGAARSGEVGSPRVDYGDEYRDDPGEKEDGEGVGWEGSRGRPSRHGVVLGLRSLVHHAVGLQPPRGAHPGVATAAVAPRDEESLESSAVASPQPPQASLANNARTYSHARLAAVGWVFRMAWGGVGLRGKAGLPRGLQGGGKGWRGWHKGSLLTVSRSNTSRSQSGNIHCARSPQSRRPRG